jgi:hypothetical protein
MVEAKRWGAIAGLLHSGKKKALTRAKLLIGINCLRVYLRVSGGEQAEARFDDALQDARETSRSVWGAFKKARKATRGEEGTRSFRQQYRRNFHQQHSKNYKGNPNNKANNNQGKQKP